MCVQHALDRRQHRTGALLVDRRPAWDSKLQRGAAGIQASTPVSTQERLQGEQFEAARRAHALEPCEVEGLRPWEA
eukprot:5907937-Prymnesium_polylepis.1